MFDSMKSKLQDLTRPQEAEAHYRRALTLREVVLGADDPRVADVVHNLGTVAQDLGHLSERLTRVEVHLKDQNADKHGPEHIRCTMEARPRGLAPMSSHADAADIPAALKGAATKLRGRLQSMQNKRDPHR